VVGFHVEDMGDGYVLRGVNKGAGSEAAGHWVLCSAILEQPSPGMIRMKADYVSMGRSAPTKDGLELFHIDHALYDVPQRTGADPGKYELDLEPSWW
jgi:hypothetical protein